ncbi:zinc finger matrin-type protein CG9776 isoform X2 [Battus philenor]|uniref:zinc finger matrin-type protein CG9776 isoform X2 n=1 Tax=Battus philenor TaxID=42288 RepID=UPI0035CFFB1F
MSRDITRKPYYNRGRTWDRNNYSGHQMPRKRSRSPGIRDSKRRSRSPRKTEKELDETILNEISKLPEPNELWDNQFQEAGFNSNVHPPPTFSQEGGSYTSNYQPSYSGIYEDFSQPHQSSGHPSNIGGWSQVPMQPPPSAQQVFVSNMEDQIKKEAAIESEMRHQKAALSKQREDCMRKATILKKELETLKEQRSELHSDPKRSPSPDTKRFLKENTKLQLEIQNKLKTINNVVDMLNGIIGEEPHVEKSDSDEPKERSSRRKSRSPSAKRFNYVYYDPEMHWCRVCNEFPATAKDYLTHLHSPAHHKMASSHMEAPWHSVPGMNEGFPNYPSAPNKRTPIRGLQFFVPSTAWYCKLCDQFIGDLHCASAHLKSIVHSKNYTNFVEQNPHWDTDWMSDRQKAFEKIRGKEKAEEKSQYTAHTITFSKDGFHTKRKNSPVAATSSGKKRKKDRKKKKSKKKRSSTESDSSGSSSDSEAKKSKKKKEKPIDEKVLSEWMSSIPMNYNERKLLDNLKSRAEESERRKSHSHDDRSRRDDRRTEDRREERQERREERQERREDRREDRSRYEREERTDRRDERPEREEKRDSMRSADVKKPETKKMPFIGKMPVFKNLGKNVKNEDQKKDEEKKKQEEEQINKKRREEMDAEIQKKVAIFKEKIAKAQFEKEQQEMTMSAQLGFLPPPALLNPPPLPPPQAPNNLPKDFQDALDIIFPSNAKPPELAQQELFMPGISGFPSIPGVVPPFTQFSLPSMSPMMMGFDINSQLFPPRPQPQPQPQLYDTHVPLMPQNNQKKKQKPTGKARSKSSSPVEDKMEKLDTKGKNKEELDELAMLGIDASDVGAGI